MFQDNGIMEGTTKPSFEGARVVISGMSGLYPDSKSVKDLADILYNKINPVTSKNQRWNYSHPEVIPYTGKLSELNLFDAQFFKVHYRLSNNMDAMSRKALEQAYQAIYDAGVSPEHLSGKKVGVYFGMCLSETDKALFYVPGVQAGFSIAGCNKAMFANRISYWLNAKGPSMSIDEDCCSSIGALEQAYFAICRGECEAAIVGGVNLCLHPQTLIHYGRVINLCKDGKTKSFDRHADGCAKSEAVNILFLQKASNALRVYAEIVHVKSEFTMLLEGNTGPKFGFCRDPVDASNFLNKFYEEANVTPSSVDYVEAFGSGDPDADKCELEIIDAVFCKNRMEPLPVGSIMSNIGNTDAATGISSITKVLLGYETGMIAGNLHYTTPRTDISGIRDGRIFILDKDAPTNRNYAAINNMSLSGVHAHVLLKGCHKQKDLNRYKSSFPRLVTVSGRQPSAVKKVIDDLKSRPIDPEELALLHNIHQTSISGHVGRGFVILDQNDEHETICLKETMGYFDDVKRPLWFVYSGMGSQWPTMGSQLMCIPIFAASIERCRKVLEPRGIDIISILTSPDKSTFDNILHSFVGIAAIQIGLTDILKALGIVPDKLIGHSVGELGCAYADGCLTAEEMILSAYSRGLVSVQTPFIRGSMAAVGIGYNEISSMCPPSIEVACHNSSESSTISGPADDMRQFIAELVSQGIFAREVPCSNIAYHSRYIAEAGPSLLKYLKEVIKTPRMRSERWMSTSVPQHRWNEPVAKYSSAEYHTNNLLNPVLFEETAELIPSNAVLIEIAPHGLLQAILKRSLHPNCRSIALTRRGHPDNVVLLLEGIGDLYMEGFTPRLQEIYPKIEFPVSTGTPMLSHLVEWVHTEKWSLPLFVSADRKTAASCKFVISLHDDESKFLYGNVVNGKILYPFAAALVAVWDTLAMTLQATRRNISVIFRDVKLYSQPILHEQRQLRLSIVLHRGTGRFEIMNEFGQVATGFISKTKQIDEFISEIEDVSSVEVLDLKVDDIYSLFKLRGYSYNGKFRSIHEGNFEMTSFSLLWDNDWVTFIDALLQVHALRQPHNGISQPTEIRYMSIDITEQAKNFKIDDKNILQAKVSDVHETTKCGGIILKGVQLQDLPYVSEEGKLVIKSSKFVPRFGSTLNDNAALHVFSQIVAENNGNEELNIVSVKKGNNALLPEVKNLQQEVIGCTIKNREINYTTLRKKPELLKDADLVIVYGLSTDDDMCQTFFKELKRDSFILNIEDEDNEKKKCPSSLYRIVSAIGKLQLLRWRPLDFHDIGVALSVNSHSDLSMLISTLNSPIPRSRLLIFTHYPPPEGFLELISCWRQKTGSNHKLQIVMGNQDTQDLPNNNLLINVLKNHTYGGYYFLPVKQSLSIIKSNFKLEVAMPGNLNSLKWVLNTQCATSGIEVKVHYASISKADVSKAMMDSSVLKQANYFGYDFAGITKSGDRVMGIVVDGSCKSTVIARPNLLWPIPSHWDFEDAATVPVAYLIAFYCLQFCIRIIRCKPQKSITIHGGAGALGQAMISIALALDYEVFVTVSDRAKKRFLLKLFPGLKEENIGNSRDASFGDMVLTATKQQGSNIVIHCLKDELRNVSLKCSGEFTLDVAGYNFQGNCTFGMNYINRERSYVMINVAKLLMEENAELLNILHKSIANGISRGYVRPLSRVTYDPQEVSRAFRLLAKSQHRGRVLLKLDESVITTSTRIQCNPNACYVVFIEKDVIGVKVVEMLIDRGARKFYLHHVSLPKYLVYKIQEWKKIGVKVEVSSEKIKNDEEVLNILKNAAKLGDVDGIIFNAMNLDENEREHVGTTIKQLDKTSRNLFSTNRYFAIITDDPLLGLHVCISRNNDGYSATCIKINPPKQNSSVTCLQSNIYKEAIEAALCSSENIVVVTTNNSQESLLQQISIIGAINLSQPYDENTTLQELGVINEKSQILSNYLRVYHNITMTADDVAMLTLKRIEEIEESITALAFSTKSGLEAFFSYVDPDELLATTEMVFMSTLTNNATTREEEFDVKNTSLCIVPGLEGHHGRFRVVCERLKLPAFVLQPGLDKLNETIQETAQRYAKYLIETSTVMDNFYILGYETGIFVALELATILEQRGLTGTVFCLGGFPDDVKIELDKQLQEFQSYEELKEAVAKHMFKIMAGGYSKELDDVLSSSSSWNERVDAGVRTLLGKVPHSAQYARAQIEASLARLVQARRYSGPAAPLRSRLVLLRSPLSARSDHTRLHRLSLQPLIQHDILAPLSHAPDDLRCAAIINTHIDDEIINNFEKKNLCEVYLLNSKSYASFVTE